MRILTVLLCLLCCAPTIELFSAVPVTHREQHFEELTIGSQSYSNVTVTTQNKDYVFFLHSRGMMNIKVTQLPVEVRQQLGYEVPSTQSVAKVLAQKTLVQLEQPQVKEVQKQIETRAKAFSAGDFNEIKSNLPIIGAVLAVAFLLYLFTCYCCMLICRKVGQDPGVMVWLPVLQAIPLLRAAGMAPIWLVAWLIPVLNIVATIVWSFRIAKARGKSFWTGLFLILPFTSLFAFLYLAFSSGQQPAEEKSEMVSLGAA